MQGRPLAAQCRCAMGGVDIHTHFVPSDFPAYIGTKIPVDWPSMAPADACHRHVMIKEKVYRTVSDLCWDGEKRRLDMDAQGIGLQAVSPMPELLSYWMDKNDAQVLSRYLNDQIGDMVAASDGRMIGLGTIPLQDVDLAIRELTHLMRSNVFAGVEVGSNVNGVPIGDLRFAPFFEAAEALGAAVFVHALKPTGQDRLIGPKPLLQALAYPTDVGLAAASVICTNVLTKFPKLRIAFSHGGGTLGSLLPRLDQAYRVFGVLNDSMHTAPAVQARQFFYDTLVFDDATLRHLIDLFGSTQLMIGTDYPFAFRENDPRARVEAASADQHLRDLLLYRNAEIFLGLHAGSEI
ncbi:aminocarboxymuconate-semialdehyde decarboxylase [Robbsia andropogonis]|uniref:2-amino-3-carboxymuconate-6-semialdehyde decarboxylase n=1 Tax=Robbsia andropogonis TaxID=28092 RepID=A0A0F5K6I5_9BURK|nr:amidohydrolase family protein [Robbsia andropogonis]KKB65137.1 aminocarboxymuconate-semialdehyde decarboxylase [Robbsia andropogonis]MCP1121084.1 amidohydrolase [Robbsia andropogonis]MCP1130916.1 amidohydrolase [Robbsia andropogonis]